MQKTIVLAALILCSSSSPDNGDSSSSQNKAFNAALKAQNNRNYDAAIQFYQQAIDQKSDDVDSWNNMGYCYRMTAQGYLDKSGNAYAKAIEYNPKHEKALEYQGEYFLMVGQIMSAYRNYKTLKEMNSDEAAKLKRKLDSTLEEAKAVLKVYNP